MSGGPSNSITCSNSVTFDILNNDPIDKVLHVVMVISNPCEYKRRWQLANEFRKRLEVYDNIVIYVVELIYDQYNKGFHVTQSTNPKHLQIRTNTSPLWHKENMVNLAVKHLLPSDWKAVAWIDADIEFENAHWVQDTLKILNGSKDIVQLFSHCIDMDAKKEPMKFFTSFGYQHCNKGKKEFWHPGFAWAITRKGWDRIGQLYDMSVLGSGDYNMAKSLVGEGISSIHKNNSSGYKESIHEYQKKATQLRLGYVPGIIRHHYHGSKKNRGYSDRWKILVKHNFNPDTFLVRTEQGLLIPSQTCPQEFLNDVMRYFDSRKEDEIKNNT